MARNDNERYIDNGPNKLEVMLAVFDTEMGERSLRFRDAFSQDWYIIKITGGHRRNSAATDWDLEGTLGNGQSISMRYLTEKRTGHMQILVDGPLFRSHEAQKTDALLRIIHRMIAEYQHFNRGSLSDEVFRLFEVTKRIDCAKDAVALDEAVKQIPGK